MVKRVIVLMLLVLLAAVGGWIWFLYCGDVTHRDLKMFVEREGAQTRELVDKRFDAMEKKLDRIESKLDRLLEMATPKFPDGMRPAKGESR